MRGKTPPLGLWGKDWRRRFPARRTTATFTLFAGLSKRDTFAPLTQRPTIFRRLAQLACAAFLLACLSNAGAVTFIPLGATWRYLDDGSNQSNAWRTVEYEDDGWATGPAELGYGDGDEATEVSYGTNASTKFITTYFRHVFTVTDRTAVSNLVLRMIRDDGAIVYLNGVEVFRDNMPGSGVTYTTRASASIGGDDETTFVGTNINPALLVNGPNLLAVEIHQDSQSSSDISFNLELTDGRSDSPVVSILSPANNSFVPGPSDLLISVSATDPVGSVTNVQLFAGNVLLGHKTAPPYTFTWTNVPPGARIITASARDDDGLLSVSTAVKFTVGLGVTNVALVPLGTAWRYLDNGSDQGTAWRASAFNDSSWKTGPSKLGYGEGDEATIVSFGPVSTNKYITTYFRKQFNVPNLSQVPALIMRLVRDDGAIVYLNGSEVHRSNMPGGAVNYLTPASTSLSTPDEDSFVRVVLNPSSLVQGTNTIAVEIHQASATSGDMGFNLELLSADLPQLVRGPFLQTPTTTNIIIKWRTDASVVGRVRYGLSPSNLNFFRNGAAAATDHRIALTNLSPDTKYYYSIGTTSAVLLAGPEYSFTTATLPGVRKKTRFWALGDAGTANADQFNVRDAAYRVLGTNRLDLVLLLGDNAYNVGSDSEYQRAIFECYPATLRNTPLWSTIGNHETAQSPNPSSTIAYYQIFSLPQDGEAGGLASGTEDYYSFDHANIHFVCLDSMTSSRAANGAMANWLRADLESTTQDWIVAFWHHPPYTKGSHNSDTEVELIEMRQNILPILEAHGVDLILAGHSHAYERSHLLDGHYGTSGTLTPAMTLNTGGGRPDGAGAYLKPNGTSANGGAVYVVTGSAGKISGGNLNHPAMFLSLNRLGSLLVDVDGDRLDARFIRENGATNDYFSIIKGPRIVESSVTSSATSTAFSWTSVAGRTYRIEYKNDLSDTGWQILPQIFTGTGAEMRHTNTHPAGLHRYYRVRMD